MLKISLIKQANDVGKISVNNQMYGILVKSLTTMVISRKGTPKHTVHRVLV